MPKLSSVRDPEELDNLYSDKTIVYVEGESDETVYSVLAGPDVRDRLEFKTPKVAGSGYHVVRDRVLDERGRGNLKVYGLLDGEASASFGHLDRFIANRATLFKAPDVQLEGLIFLSETELENLFLCHADIAEFLVNNVSLMDIGKRDRDQHDADLAKLARRFFLLAMLKLTAGEFHRAGTPCKSVDRLAGRFQTTVGAVRIAREVKAELEADGVSWTRFVKGLSSLLAKVRASLEDDGGGPTLGDRHVRRLADGKGMFKRVGSKYKMAKTWEGHVVERLRSSPYADLFRDALLLETGIVKPTTP